MNNRMKIFCLALVLLGVLLGAYLTILNCSVDWEGTYKNTFTVLDEKDDNFYVKISPKVKIEEIDDHYSITVTLMTSRVPANGNALSGQVGGTHYIPTNVSALATGRHIYFETKFNETDKDVGIFCELKYIDEQHIEFRYAKTKEELKQKEFYSLVKLK